MEHVAAGRYRIVPIPGVTPGYYPAAVLLNGQDVLGQEITLAPGMPPLRIVYKPNPGTIRGAVPNGDGATVLVWPQRAITMDLVRAMQAGAGGVFEIGGLPPGDYAVVAVDRQNLESLSEAELRGLTATATRTSVEENGAATVTLQLTHLPE